LQIHKGEKEHMKKIFNKEFLSLFMVAIGTIVAVNKIPQLTQAIKPKA